MSMPRAAAAGGPATRPPGKPGPTTPRTCPALCLRHRTAEEFKGTFGNAGLGGPARGMTIAELRSGWASGKMQVRLPALWVAYGKARMPFRDGERVEAATGRRSSWPPSLKACGKHLPSGPSFCPTAPYLQGYVNVHTTVSLHPHISLTARAVGACRQGWRGGKFRQAAACQLSSSPACMPPCPLPRAGPPGRRDPRPGHDGLKFEHPANGPLPKPVGCLQARAEAEVHCKIAKRQRTWHGTFAFCPKIMPGQATRGLSGRSSPAARGAAVAATGRHAFGTFRCVEYQIHDCSTSDYQPTTCTDL